MTTQSVIAMIVENILIVMVRLGLILVGTPETGAGTATAAELWIGAGAWSAGADDGATAAVCGADLDGSAANPTVVRRSVRMSVDKILVNMFPSSLLDFSYELFSQSVKIPVGNFRVIHGDKNRYQELGQDKQIAEVDDPDQLDFK